MNRGGGGGPMGPVMVLSTLVLFLLFFGFCFGRTVGVDVLLYYTNYW